MKILKYTRPAFEKTNWTTRTFRARLIRSIKLKAAHWIPSRRSRLFAAEVIYAWKDEEKIETRLEKVRVDSPGSFICRLVRATWEEISRSPDSLVVVVGATRSSRPTLLDEGEIIYVRVARFVARSRGKGCTSTEHGGCKWRVLDERYWRWRKRERKRVEVNVESFSREELKLKVKLRRY